MTQRYLSILDRYIGKELLFTWMSVTLVLVLILVSGILARLLGQAANGVIPDDAILPLLAMTALHYFISVNPLALYLAVLLTFSRFYKDNEMAAMNACGIGLLRLYRSVMVMVIPLTLLVFVLALFVQPWLVQQMDAYKQQIESRSDLSGLVAGQFNKADKATLFIEKRSANGKTMQNIFSRQLSGSSTAIETSKQLQRYRDEQGRGFVVFIDGQYYEGEVGQADYSITRYQKHGVFVPEKKIKQRTRSEALSSRFLWQSTDNSWHQAELQWRLSMPLLTFLLAMLAVPLSYTTPRNGRYSKLAVGILIYVVYVNLAGVAQTWLEHQKVPQWLGMWWIHSFGLLLIVFLLVKRYGGIKSVFFQIGRAKT